MKKIIFSIVTLIFMIASRVYAYDDGDFQVWHTEVQEFKISDGLKVETEEEIRFEDDGGNLYYQHYQGGASWDWKPWLALGLSYRQIYEKKKDKFREENRPQMDAVLKWTAGELKFEDRNRLSYRHFDYQSDFWLYRNKFTVKLPWKFTPLEIQPYFSDEIFLNFIGAAFSRNRFYSGFSANLTKNIKAELFYLLQNTRSSGKWLAANVLGTKVKPSF